MNPGNFSYAAAERLIRRIQKRADGLSEDDQRLFKRLVAAQSDLTPGKRLNPQQVSQLHTIAEKCNA